MTDPSTVVFVALEHLLLDRLVAVAKGTTWEVWSRKVRQRYVLLERASAARADTAASRLVVTDGHLRTVAWMATQAFRDMVRVHEAACAGRAAIYFQAAPHAVGCEGVP